MKNIFIIFCLTLSTVISHQSNAQTISSKIMDASLKISTGELSVFLTDTLGISGVEISVGTSPDTFSVYSQQFTITGNNFGSGTISNNTLHTVIAGLSGGTEYYTRIRILLDNSEFNEIEIHSN